MSHTAVVITVAYAIAVVIGLAIAAGIFQSTQRPAADDRIGTWSRRETTWLVIVVLTLFALLLATIFYVPYGASAGANSQFVRVTGRQFAWQIDAPDRLVVGKPVVFYTKSVDVAHGFGVYNPDHKLIFQAQVAPQKTQKIVHTFTQPGTYTVHCLEFCGAGHHLMSTTFEVKRA